MWKAIIKLIEKLAYRCDHDYELLSHTNIFDVKDGNLNKAGGKIGQHLLYACKKCRRFKEKRVSY